MIKSPITLLNIFTWDILKENFSKIAYKGVFDKDWKSINPYKNVKYSMGKIYPIDEVGKNPILEFNGKKERLFTPQPTIYTNQLKVFDEVELFLSKMWKSITNLWMEFIEYSWEWRWIYHMLPPIVEKFEIDFKNWFIDRDAMIKRFEWVYIKDYIWTLHHLWDRYLKNFHIDEEYTIKLVDVFNDNLKLINYWTNFNWKNTFYVICDWSHRVDFALEILQKPINAMIIEWVELPYYALPQWFFPMTRISSKLAETAHWHLYIDKIHLLNDYIKKCLHYDWDAWNLKVSKLRSNLWTLFKPN